MLLIWHSLSTSCKDEEKETQEDKFGKSIDKSDEVVDNDTILGELSECFGRKEKSGEPVNENLAKVTSLLIVCGHCSMQNKIKEVSEKYNRPQNVLYLTPS